MKKLLVCLALMLGSLTAAAQSARVFSQAELDALVAPVALYPDTLLMQVLVAATYPHQVAEAAGWSRANPRLAGDEAVRAVQPYGWHPAVAALAAFPDLLARMGESPQWVRDLGEAYQAQEPYVMDTVQRLRARAEANGSLRSDAQQQVYRQDQRIVVQPVYSQVVYVPYYDPLIVFGPWWWPSYCPVFWRPWYARPVFYRWHPPRYWQAQRVSTPPPAYIRPTQAVPQPARPATAARPQVSSVNGPPSPAARMQAAQSAAFVERQQHRAATPMPPVGGFSHRESGPRREAHQQRGRHRG